MVDFIGRDDKLATLAGLTELRSASLVVVNGRRRIGKSRLINHFAKPYKFYKFNALTPRKGITAQHQRDEFMRQFKMYFELPTGKMTDWGDIFTLLAKQTDRGRMIILFDEISWMATGDLDFLGKLKIAWDEHFTKNSKTILFLCGSVSSWIEENLLSDTGFLGRPSLHIHLDELPLPDCVRFWDDHTNDISAYEKLKILSVTGGVPRYLELINPKQTAEENIKRLFFNKDSMLFDEFEKIFRDIYGKRTGIYQDIVSQLIAGPATQEDIVNALTRSRSGDLSQYMNDLIQGGFVKRDFIWKPSTGKLSNLSKYRLSDNYLRFALKYILPNRALIEKDRFSDRSLTSLPGWDVMMGLQFENLVVNNHKKVIEKLGILEQDIIFDNPYFQRKTQRIRGCQIDYMIQTRHDTVYVCEIKFHRQQISSEIIESMRQKLESLKLPKHISKRTVLIHVNGVKEQLIDQRFFTKIIDFSELLK